MTTGAIAQTLIDYQKVLDFWFQNKTRDDRAVLAVLRSRDALHAALQQSPTPGIYTLTKIQTLDQKLQQQSSEMSELLDFKEYRKSFPKASDHWWWALDTQKPAHCRDQYDWLFKGLTIGAWTVSLALLIDISGRFLLGGAGVAGLSAITFSSLMTLIQARNDLTDAGRQSFDTLVKNLKVPSHLQEKARLGSIALLTAALFTFWLSLPIISNQYNRRGLTDHYRGKLGTAEQNYKRAISLNPDNVDAHYNLSTLYENLQEIDKAKTQYLIAIQGDLPDAYNNLARLYLQPPNPNLPKAVALLNQGLKLADEQQSPSEVKYSLYKNLGWARLQQKRYREAKRALKTAIAISELPDAQSVANLGSAYCLLAQALDVQNRPAALQTWQRCCQLANSGDPNEDAWLFQSRQRLAAKGADFNQSCLPNASPLP